jgi:predicted protein tyrosine phosphatase
MFIEYINRHLTVCSARELPAVARRDPGFWHSISIMEPWRKLAPREGLRDVLSLRFDDAENLDTDETGITFVRPEQIAEAFYFADDRWGEPLLIQCWAGLSRSAALALGMISRGMFMDGVESFAEEAVDLLLQIRPEARPNVLVLRLALETFLPAEQAETFACEMVNHPELLANRFHRSK